MKRMMTVLVGFALTATLAGAPAGARDSAAATLAPGEVLLQLTATGSSSNPADSVTVLVAISARGATATAAREANRANIERVRKALIAHGVGAGAISIVSSQMPFAYMDNEATSAGLPEAMMPGAPPVEKKSAAVLQVQLDDPARLSDVTAALDAENQTMVGGPIYELKNNVAAHTAAMNEAIAKARAEAERSAAALGMQVAHIARVSNYGKESADPQDYMATLQAMQSMMTGRPGAGAQVVTRARVWVDFVLRPR